MKASLIALLLLLAVIATLFLFGTKMLRRFLGLPREQAFLVTIATVIGAAVMVFWRIYQLDAMHVALDRGPEPPLMGVACRGLLVIFAVPLGIKLYRAWLGTHTTPEERSPGSVGLRAWLTPSNLILATLVALTASGAYDCPFFGIFTLLIGCLLVQPLLNTLSDSPPVAGLDRTLAAEREKILSLLESGIINAEESAELLNALGSTAQPTFAATRAPISPQRRVMLIGAGLLLLGFFLPWFSINPGKELNHMTGEMQHMMQGFSQSMPEGMPGMPGFGGDSGMKINFPTVNFAGGDVDHGLGWLVLLLGLGVAALPHVATTMDASTRRTISLVALGVGGLILAYLITRSFRFINVGVIMALAGYVMVFVGILNPRSAQAGFTPPKVIGQA